MTVMDNWITSLPLETPPTSETTQDIVDEHDADVEENPPTTPDNEWQ